MTRVPLRIALVLLTALAVDACPMPIARTETTSAPVSGRILWADGTPLAHAPIVISTQWNDKACSRGVLHTTTDAAGAFALPATQQHYEVTWFVPNLDRVASSYQLCAGVADTLRAAYVGSGSLGPVAQPDSVTCVAWEWQDRLRVSCSGRAHESMLTGGRWSAADSGATGAEQRASAGFFRVFLTEEPTRVKGYKGLPDRPHVYVQWLEERLPEEPDAPSTPSDAPSTPSGAPGAPYRVRATAELPFDTKKVWSLRDADIWQREGKWVVALHGWKHAFMNDIASAELLFELGAPGQASKVAGP